MQQRAMVEIIGADHEFHDEEFVTGWAERFAPTAERLQLFDLILAELKSLIPANSCIIELGIGPGYLADHLLKALPEIQFYGIDFSKPMLDIARHRLKSHSARVNYVQADLVKENWWIDISTPVDAIVSTWALHDLGSQESVAWVYKTCAQVLPVGGVVLNGDFIKPDKAIHEYEDGRFEIAKHIDILLNVGFKRAECLLVLEEEIKSPTSAHNYACIKAIK